MRPDAVVVSQATCNAVTVEAGRLRFPAAGNDALLAARKPGTALAGNRVDAAARQAKATNNLFGFLRKVSKVSQVGADIVVETTRANLQDVVLVLR